MVNTAAANFVEELRADKRFAATADIFEESFRLLHEGVDYAVGIPTGTVLTDWQNLQGFYGSSDIVQFAGSSSGLTVKYCGIIGGGDGSGLIGATGNFNIQYNLMKDFPQRAVELYDNVSLDMRYNVIENRWNGFRIASQLLML